MTMAWYVNGNKVWFKHRGLNQVDFRKKCTDCIFIHV